MRFSECRRLIVSDLSRLTKSPSFCGGGKFLISNASFRITFWFRIGSYLKTKSNPLHKLLFGLVFLIHKHNQYLTGIQLPFGTKIGAGLNFAHFSCIIINNSCTIGQNCTIFQGVTVGSVRGPEGGVPSIGDNVVLASGTQVIGNVKIGNNVMIGAGAVVVTDIPDNAVAVGVPAKVVSFNGKTHAQLYISHP